MHHDELGIFHPSALRDVHLTRQDDEGTGRDLPGCDDAFAGCIGIEDGYLPSILPAAAAIAARTNRIRIASGVLLMPFHNPIRLAEDIATVDVISGGRFELGVGIGFKQE